MRLGAPVFGDVSTPGLWAKAHVVRGYGAAYCPIGYDADAGRLRPTPRPRRKVRIVIAEVGAWSNPLSQDKATRTAAMDLCRGS